MTPTKPIAMTEQAKKAAIPSVFEASLRRSFLNFETPEALPLLPFRRRALEAFEQQKFPTRRDEAWKYLNLAPLLGQAVEPYEAPAAVPDLKPHLLKDANGARLVFVNGHYQAALSDVSALPKGVLLQPLQTALQQQADKIEPILHQALNPEKPLDSFHYLNLAASTDGVFFNMPAGQVFNTPVQMLFINLPSETPKAAFLNNIFLLEEGSEATVSIQTLSLGQRGASHLHHCIQSLVLKENAKLDLIWTQLEDHDAWQMTNHRLWLSQAAQANISHIDIGSAVARHSIDVAFSGEQAHCELNGLNVLKGNTQVYHHVVMNHDKPNNTSEQFYKSILDDHTRAEFNGTVKVAPNANGTDAHQLNKNLLLSEDAHTFARPQLQILADDVKCNHGATVGQLDKTQLFYMTSRGLEPELAECLLTYGFAEEMIEKLPLPSLRSYVDAHMLTQLDQHNNPLACHVSCHHCD